MTVRWKPLLILSGLFVVVAIAGLMTIATVMGSRSSGDFVARARAERKAKEYDKAKLDYQIALKSDNRNAALHEELADLCREWMAEAPAEKKADLRNLYVSALTSAANFGAKRAEPRRKLLSRGDAARRSGRAGPLGQVAGTHRPDRRRRRLRPRLGGARRHLAQAHRGPPPPRRSSTPRSPGESGPTGSPRGWRRPRNDKDQLDRILDPGPRDGPRRRRRRPATGWPCSASGRSTWPRPRNRRHGRAGRRRQA